MLKFFDRANFSTGLRNTAYMMRAVRRFKKAEPPYDSKTISKGELDQAKIVSIKVMQSDMFSDQLAILQRGSKVNSGPYRKWGLYIDSDGVIRCDIHTNDHLLEPSARTNPILIHGKHPFVESYFKYKHKHSNCSSKPYTLHKVRKELHGPSLTVTVNKIVRECNACRILRAKPYAYPKMPPLPKERLAAERPFAVCGVDYSGPHHVKEGRSRKKIWIALFTCMVSRAVHLEVVPDISALTFLQALQSLAWKKGTPKLLMSDNATCFTGANRLLKEMSEERQVQVDLATKGIEWSFTPPRAPWFGAIYERLIGVMKKELVKLIGHSLLTYHELTTNLAQVEGIVNSRPLIQVGTEEVLTPMNILTGRDDNKDDILNVLDTKEILQQASEVRKDLPKLYTQTAHRLSRFWQVFQHQYLESIKFSEDTSSKKGSGLTPTAGDLVIMHSHDPRIRWRKAIILDAIKSKDGFIRKCEVKTSTGKMVKATKHLNLLEMNVKNMLDLHKKRCWPIK